jgi:urease accessory protein
VEKTKLRGMKKKISSAALVRFLSGFSLLAMTSLAQAHPGPGEPAGFAGGFAHPLLGLDHILAMVAVGLWAAQLGGRARWRVPASFLALMTLGGIAGMSGVKVPGVEEGIVISVLVLGVMIVASVRLPLAMCMGVVGLFAVFHGHAHGAEIPATASSLFYCVGFVACSALLHAAGIGFALTAQRWSSRPVVRWAGAAVLAGGVLLCLI